MVHGVRASVRFGSTADTLSILRLGSVRTGTAVSESIRLHFTRSDDADDGNGDDDDDDDEKKSTERCCEIRTETVSADAVATDDRIRANAS